MEFDICTSRFIPDTSTHTYRIKAIANELIKKKIKLRIFTNTVNDNSVKKDYEIKYFKFFTKINPKFYLLKFFFEFLDTLPLFLKVLKSNSHYCIVVIPNFSYMFFLPFLKLKKKFIIVDIMDLSWKYCEFIYPKIITKLIEEISLRILKLSDLILVTNDYEYDYFKSKNFQNVKVLSNGYTYSFEKIKKKINFSFSNDKSISYLGNLGIAQNFEPLFFLANNLKDLQVNIYGDGSKKEILKKKSSLINNFNIYNPLEYNNTYKIYNNSNFLFLSLFSEFESAIPSKIYEYLASRKKIICFTQKSSAIYKKFNNLFKNQLFMFTDYNDLLNFFKKNQNNYNYDYDYDHLSINNITSSFIDNLIKNLKNVSL